MPDNPAVTGTAALLSLSALWWAVEVAWVAVEKRGRDRAGRLKQPQER